MFAAAFFAYETVRNAGAYQVSVADRKSLGHIRRKMTDRTRLDIEQLEKRVVVRDFVTFVVQFSRKV